MKNYRNRTSHHPSNYYQKRTKKTIPNKKSYRTKLNKIEIKGYKSLKDVKLKLSDINILLGPNGVGKSNFLQFFEMLGWMMRSGRLEEYVGLKGGASDLLFNGSKYTTEILAYMSFVVFNGTTEYKFRLNVGERDRLLFTREEYRFNRINQRESQWRQLNIGQNEAQIVKHRDQQAKITSKILQKNAIYQFHDTSFNSRMKQACDVSDNFFMKVDAANLPAILLNLRENEHHVYNEIIDIIHKILPIFRDFELYEKYGKVFLRWEANSQQDKSFGANLTSDGSLRLFALVTLLCMPENQLPDVILLDEPELGLHPKAIHILGELIRKVATKKQMIIATQSVLLVNEFELENIIVTEMDDEGATFFKRLKYNDYKAWLEDYKVSDLWIKNIIGGNP